MTLELSQHGPAEEKFRLAVEACPSGMVMTDSAGLMVLVNTATEELFGYRRGELIGSPFEMLLPNRLKGAYLKQRAILTLYPPVERAPAAFDFLGLRRDGSEFPLEIRFNPIRSESCFFLLSLVDISDRHRMDRLKDEFVSTVSHELRTPLTSIAGALALLIGGAVGPLPEPVLRLLTIAHNNSQRLVRLINDILDIEKIESGQVTFAFRPVAAIGLIEQAIDANRAYADSFGVSVKLRQDSDAAEIYADPDRLSQVLTNLLSNAIKFSPRNGEVTIAAERRGDSVRVSVRDRGPGIPAEFKPRVFEKFAQADASDARRKNGTGLGLSIAKEIVLRLGGSLGFADAEGGGTVFFVDLQAADTIASHAEDSDRAADAVQVLLCEDDPAAAMVIRNGVRPFGFSVDFAYNASDALVRVRTGSYRGLIVDLDLPDAGGIGFIRALRSEPKAYKTPIVMLATRRTGEAAEFAKLEGSACITKPADVYHLAQMLDRLTSANTDSRARILHIDDDRDVLELVAEALEPTLSVVSVASAEQAEQALLADHFDLAILDITLGSSSGLDLLPKLRNPDGTHIPVIIFSAHLADLRSDARVEAQLSKGSLAELVAAVHDRLALGRLQTHQEVA